MLKVAVILSGCGVYDGSEIHEACAALLALDQAGAAAVVCAPAGPQLHVVNHLAGEPAGGEIRDILVESARLARGNITAVSEVDPAAIDAVLLPGGFGAAKNLCTFATEQDLCSVQPEVESFLRRAHAAGKPIGAMCIAPVVLARVFGRELHPRLTIGRDAATAGLVEKMGAEHVACAPTEILCDEKNRMVTTPAYMLADNISDVFAGAASLVTGLLAMAR